MLYKLGLTSKFEHFKDGWKKCLVPSLLSKKILVIPIKRNLNEIVTNLVWFAEVSWFLLYVYHALQVFKMLITPLSWFFTPLRTFFS